MDYSPRGRKSNQVGSTGKSDWPAPGPPKEKVTPQRLFRSVVQKSSVAAGGKPMKVLEPEAGLFLEDTWRGVDHVSPISNLFQPNGYGCKALKDFLVLGMTQYRGYVLNLVALVGKMPHELKKFHTFGDFIRHSHEDPSRFLGFSMPPSLDVPLPASFEFRPGTLIRHLSVLGPGNYSMLSHGCLKYTLESQLQFRMIDSKSFREVINDVETIVSDWFQSIRQNCIMACGSIQLLLTTLYRTERRFQLEKWCYRFFDKSLCDLLAGQYEHRMKYLCARIQAETLDELKELPPRPDFMDPDDRHFLGGQAYSWFFDKTCEQGRRRDPVRRLEILNALTALKKRQPTIPSERLEKSTGDWYKAIFTKGQDSNLTFEDRAEVFSVVQEIVNAMDFKTSVAVPTLSTASRLGYKVMAGGTFGFYKESLRTELQHGQTIQQVQDVLEVECLDPTSQHYGQKETFAVPIPSLVSKLFSTGASEAAMSGLMVEPVALPEPFKVRMISKGPPHQYWTVAVLQKVMHSALQSLPCFRLTREQPLHDIVDILNENLGCYIKPGHFYVSGDYTAATDKLDPSLSNYIVDMISTRLGLSYPERLAFRASLTGHTTQVDGDPILEHDAELYGFMKSNFKVKKAAQTWGQLMGSPTSFPVLCIANLALTIAALRRVEGRTVRPVKNCGIVINGDDITFMATMESIASWKEITKKFGLAPSLGKNFLSRDFLQINSKMFYVAQQTYPSASTGGEVSFSTWCQVPNASLAVLLPPRKVTFEEFCSIAPSMQRTFLGDFKGEDRDFLNSLYTRVWSDYLSLLPSGEINWWLPRDYGGFGLEPTRPVRVNPLQRRVAAFLRDSTQVSALVKYKPKFASTSSMSTAHGDAEEFYKHLSDRGILDVVWLDEDEESFSIPHLEGDLNLSGYTCIKPTQAHIDAFVELQRSSFESLEGDERQKVVDRIYTDFYLKNPQFLRFLPNEPGKMLQEVAPKRSEFLLKLMREYRRIRKSASRSMFDAPTSDDFAVVSVETISNLSKRRKGYRPSLRFGLSVPRGPQVKVQNSTLKLRRSHGTATYEPYLPFMRRHLDPGKSNLLLLRDSDYPGDEVRSPDDGIVTGGDRSDTMMHEHNQNDRSADQTLSVLANDASPAVMATLRKALSTGKKLIGFLDNRLIFG